MRSFKAVSFRRYPFPCSSNYSRVVNLRCAFYQTAFNKAAQGKDTRFMQFQLNVSGILTA